MVHVYRVAFRKFDWSDWSYTILLTMNELEALNALISALPANSSSLENSYGKKYNFNQLEEAAESLKQGLEVEETETGNYFIEIYKR